MKLDRRTIEAFRRLNTQLKGRYYGIAAQCRRYLYAYPELVPLEPAFDDTRIFKLKLSNRAGTYGYFIGFYRTEELLRAGVETAAEFLEEVM